MYHTTIGLIAATFGVALLHASMPNHWMPFVLVGKAQKWNITRTLTITGIASLGHSTITCIIGFIVAVMGFQITRHIEGHVGHLTGGILIFLGIAYVVFNKWRHKGAHTHGEHAHHELPDKVAITSLLTMLCFSPCEAALPIFLAGSAMSWGILFTMAVILTIATLFGMLVLTALAYRGLQRFRFALLEKYEKELVGAILSFIGIIIIIFH